MKAARGPQEEPQRLYSAVAEVAQKTSSHSRIFGSYHEVVRGTAHQQEIGDRLNTALVEVVRKGAGKVKTLGNCIEVMFGIAPDSVPPTQAFSMCVEVAQGIPVPQEITDSHRQYAEAAELMIKLQSPRINHYGQYIEVIKRFNPYSPITNVQIIY